MTDRVMVPVAMVKAVADAILGAVADYDVPEAVLAGAIMCGSQAALDTLTGMETKQ